MNKYIAISLFIAPFIMLSHVYASDLSDLKTNIKEDRVTIRQERKDIKQDVKTIKQDIKEKVTSEGKIVNGKVTAKTTTSLTISNDNKTINVTIDSNTKFIRHYYGKSSIAEISVGDNVNVWGVFTDANKITLQAKVIRDLSVMKRHGVFFGDVTSKGDNQLIMKSVNRGNQTVTITSSTKLINRTGQKITFSDIQVGDRVRINGMWDKNGNTVTETQEAKDFTLPKQNK
jgi:hypothetical protein